MKTDVDPRDAAQILEGHKHTTPKQGSAKFTITLLQHKTRHKWNNRLDGTPTLIEESMLDIGSKRVKEGPGTPVEANDFSANCRKLELHVLLWSKRPVAALVADKCEGSNDGKTIELAYVSFDTGQVLVPVQTNLYTQKIVKIHLWFDLYDILSYVHSQLLGDE